MSKPKNTVSTFEREMKDANFKKSFESNYKDFLLSELLIAIMERNNISVRGLAKEVGLSATVIQKIRSGQQEDLKISNFVGIAQACGYKIILEKNDERIEIEDKISRNKHHLNFTHI